MINTEYSHSDLPQILQNLPKLVESLISSRCLSWNCHSLQCDSKSKNCCTDTEKREICTTPWKSIIFTARQRSCGKVMFSVESVCLPTKEGPPCTGIQAKFSLHGHPLSVQCFAPLPRHIPICSPRSRDIWQADSWHSTEMLSCVTYVYSTGVAGPLPLLSLPKGSTEENECLVEIE